MYPVYLRNVFRIREGCPDGYMVNGTLFLGRCELDYFEAYQFVIYK